MVTDLLQELHDSEINFTISSFYDSTIDVKLGDELNGYVAVTQVKSFTEAERWLTKQAVLNFPKTSFAKARRKTQ